MYAAKATALGKKRRGKPRGLLPGDAPLSAQKMIEMLDYLDLSDAECAQRLGCKSHDEVWKWHRGVRRLEEKDKKVIAHEFDIPVWWWEAAGVPVGDVIGQGMGKDEPAVALTVEERDKLERVLPVMRDNVAFLQRLVDRCKRAAARHSKRNLPKNVG